MEEASDGKPLLTKENSEKDQPLLGQFFALLSALSNVTSGACVTMLQGSIPPLELNCWRFGPPLLILLVYGLLKKVTISPSPMIFIVLFGLSLSFAVNNYTYFGSMEYIGVGTVESGSVAFSQVFIAITSFVILREQIGFIKGLSIVFCLIGVFCVMQPGFLFQNIQLGNFEKASHDNLCLKTENRSTSTNLSLGMNIKETTDDWSKRNRPTCISRHSNEYIGYLMLIPHGISNTGTVLLIRGTRLGQVSCNGQLISTHCLALTISIALMFIVETPVLPQNLQAWICLSGHVTFSFLGTVFYYFSLNLTSGILVYLAYSPAIVFSMVTQYFIVNNIQPGHRNALEVGGAVLVFIAACMNPVHQIITKKT